MQQLFTLYVAGRSGRSAQAIAAIEGLFRDASGDFYLTIVDVLEDPSAAESERILATPTLVRTSPPPRQSVVGDFRNRERVAEAIGIDVELAR
ncbi:MAG: circadian clock KaiB family protein [Nitriliruptorales bacterium]|nr:circadian clock KaiB family protein [Nitriliruptorales bacterium]